ncbi:MAG: Rieske 2Fe-2S domain-containing protein [Betaproteobacteria bacterium]|nr:Rieske 2Fe-2S domain-containing protein [Betaproteobacteria bacterium]
MSDALNYLIKARPDAVGHYFSFLKEAGKHLDPKTRNLISVITKVHAQTERGFRQYLGRALREGCTPAEILDALLMAFPALGLAKIIWATDIILAMNIPGFDLAALHQKGDWHDLMAIDDLPVDQAQSVSCDGRNVFVYRKEDAIRVFDSSCPHQTTNIPFLALKGTKLTCPKHQWVFDITDGSCTEEGRCPLKEWKNKVENGRLLAYW